MRPRSESPGSQHPAVQEQQPDVEAASLALNAARRRGSERGVIRYGHHHLNRRGKMLKVDKQETSQCAGHCSACIVAPRNKRAPSYQGHNAMFFLLKFYCPRLEQLKAGATAEVLSRSFEQEF